MCMFSGNFHINASTGVAMAKVQCKGVKNDLFSIFFPILASEMELAGII